MKSFQISTVISSAILGISIVIGAWIIRDGQQTLEATTKHEASMQSNQTQTTEPLLLTLKETADYLHLSELQVRTIISTEEESLKNTGSYTGKMFPVLRIENDIFVSKIDLIAWLADASSQRKRY